MSDGRGFSVFFSFFPPWRLNFSRAPGEKGEGWDVRRARGRRGGPGQRCCRGGLHARYDAVKCYVISFLYQGDGKWEVGGTMQASQFKGTEITLLSQSISLRHFRWKEVIRNIFQIIFRKQALDY